jgi:hypothetical protein
LLHLHSTGRVGLGEFGESFAQSNRIEGIDGEDADAALAATGMTDEPFAAAASGVGESGIDDLDEFVIASGTRSPSSMRFRVGDLETRHLVAGAVFKVHR